MTDAAHSPADPVAAPFLRRLQRLVRHDDRPAHPLPPDAAPSASAFVTRQRERIAEATFERPALVVIVEGAKELVQGSRSLRVGAGEAITLAGGWRGTVINEPTGEAGLYRALYVDFPADLIIRAQRAHPDRAPAEARGAGRTGRIALSAPLVDAILHLCEGLRAGSLAPHLVTHRAMEVLLVLADQGALPLAPASRSQQADEAVRALVRWRPDHSWSATEIARELGVSPATLRRRLAAEGMSLRTILATERMGHAQAMMTREGTSVGAAAEASGYASRSRFSRRYKAVIGVPPSSERSASERTGHGGERSGHG